MSMPILSRFPAQHTRDRAGLGQAPAPAPVISMEVLTDSNLRAVPVDFTIDRGLVRVSLCGQMIGVLDRAAVAGWLADPSQQLVSGRITCTCDSSGAPAIRLPGVRLWSLSPTAGDQLRVAL
jgi:hypothetical protein